MEIETMDIKSLKLRKRPEVAEGHVEDFTVLVAWEIEPAEAEINACLNGTGGIIWNLLDTSDTLEDIVQRIYELYDVQEEEVYEQVTNFVIQMASNGLIVLEREGGDPIMRSEIAESVGAKA